MREVPSFQTDIGRIREHIARLARVPRPCHSAELESCRQYVAELFGEYGWSVRRHEWSEVNDYGELNFGERLTGINLVATRPHTDATSASRPRLCVGAHLDSRPDTPGADDNASAVATLLEIARVLGSEFPADARLELELVAFDLEENGMLGGREHARLAHESQTDLRGMISLEMLGYCDRRPGSQQLPRSLAGLYPDTGDFIAIIGNQNSTELIEVARQGASSVNELLVETLQVPENGTLLQATRLSDHSPFWDAGFSALMITDTSFLRNPHYHQPTDTLETLDMDFLHAVAEGCVAAVRHLLANGLHSRPAA
ncbi:MAG: M28 family peptidase [Planctomycetota bacterium]|jgi:hypothetical protein